VPLTVFAAQRNLYKQLLQALFKLFLWLFACWLLAALIKISKGS